MLNDESSERPVRSESLKLWTIKFKTVKILLLFLWFTIDWTDSKWTKYCNIKAFYKIRRVYSIQIADVDGDDDDDGNEQNDEDHSGRNADVDEVNTNNNDDDIEHIYKYKT